MEIDYYAKVVALSDAAPTNTMLTNNPDIYLYGALLEAEPFLMNDARAQLWSQAFFKAIQDIQLQMIKANPCLDHQYNCRFPIP